VGGPRETHLSFKFDITPNLAVLYQMLWILRQINWELWGPAPLVWESGWSPRNTPLLQVWYHAKFGCTVSNGVDIKANKLRALGPCHLDLVHGWPM